MKLFTAQSIREKLIRIILTVIALVLIPAAVLMIVIDFYLLRRVTIRDLGILGDVVAYNSSAALAFNNKNDAAQILQSLNAEPNITQAVLFNMEGEQFAVFRPDQPIPESIPPKTIEWSPFRSTDLRHLSPIRENDLQLGWLLISYDLSNLQIRLFLYLSFTFVLIGLTLTAAWFLSQKLQERISGPIIALRKLARSISETYDYDRRAVTATDDEIGSLASAFNEMLDRIARKEEELERSEERLRAAVDSSGSGVWDRNLITGETVRIGAIYHLFDTAPPGSEIDSTDGFFNSIYEEDRPLVLEQLNHVSARGGPFEIDLRMKTTTGEIRTIRSRGRTYADSDGKPARMIGAVTDITDLRKAEAEILELNRRLEVRVKERTLELQQALEEIDSFNYSVSHDLRTPLRAINGFSLALLEDYGDSLDETALDFLNRIVASCQRMSQLIDDLLKLSRIALHEVRKEPLNLSAVAAKIIEDLRTEDPERSVEVKIEKNLETRGDPRLLSLAMENLLRNAWKFTIKQKKPRIEIGKRIENEKEYFFVTDNGAGFDMAYADRLFGVFQRLHKSSEFEGTGIGLATVRRIIERHGGEIHGIGNVDNGATFCFSIP